MDLSLCTGIDSLVDQLNQLPGVDLPHAMDVLGPILPDMLEGGKLALFNGRNGTKLNQWFLINNGRWGFVVSLKKILEIYLDG